MDMQLIHLPATEGVERIFAHPLEEKINAKEEIRRQRYAQLMHGLKSNRPHSIRVN